MVQSQESAVLQETPKVGSEKGKVEDGPSGIPLSTCPQPGVQIQKLDILTRRTDFEKGERDNANVVLLKDEFFANTIQVEQIANELTR